MKLLLLNQSNDKVPRAWLVRWVKALGRTLAKKRLLANSKSEVVVVFVTSGEMRKLNKTFRGKNYATDILSFESAEPDVLGELVICPSVIRSQSRRTGLGERGELGYMLVHGALHLLGFDHERPRDKNAMFALQDDIYAELERNVGLS